MRMTPKRADIVRALQAEDVYLLMRDAHDAPYKDRHRILSGTKLIKLVDGVEQVAAGSPNFLSGMSANGLIEAGFLELAGTRPYSGLLYVLSKKGRGLVVPPEPAPSAVPAVGRVYKRELEEIAAEHGCTVTHDGGQKWWWLAAPLFGQIKLRVMLTDAGGRPYARLGDASLSQWRSAVVRGVKQLEAQRKIGQQAEVE